ncbi:hypothetical protein [Nocardia crassostreae]|uniref:hypothetical protein n=1 Tax=Nocardia crassostreae TaxID=53428 RepID=UPI0012F84FF8|nr:hypothetical protein [Nocardia crassostreae]
MSAVVRTTPSSVLDAMRWAAREFGVRRIPTREERDARLAGYAPTAILGAVRR